MALARHEPAQRFFTGIFPCRLAAQRLYLPYQRIRDMASIYDQTYVPRSCIDETLAQRCCAKAGHSCLAGLPVARVPVLLRCAADSPWRTPAKKRIRALPAKPQAARYAETTACTSACAHHANGRYGDPSGRRRAGTGACGWSTIGRYHRTTADDGSLSTRSRTFGG